MGKPRTIDSLGSSPPPRDDDAFVWTSSGAGSGTFPASQVARHPTGSKGMLQRAGGRVTRRMTMYLAPSLARRVVLLCAETGREISDVASEALERYLEGPGGQGAR